MMKSAAAAARFHHPAPPSGGGDPAPPSGLRLRLLLRIVALLALQALLQPGIVRAAPERSGSRPITSRKSMLPGRTRSAGRTGATRFRGDFAAAYHNGTLEERWLVQPLDHFHFEDTRTYSQRYFVCSTFFAPDGPIFFYTGNEADVTLYVNATGLMWENAKEFKALLVFAEHRYYGASQPLGPDSWQVDPSFLTTEQAMADFADLILNLKFKMGTPLSPVIAFGGSYGGMLAAWMRMKYPLLVQGAVAGSAPIGAFPGSATFRPSRFWEVVTRDASPAAGAPEGCTALIHSAFQALFALGHKGDKGRAELALHLGLCAPPAGVGNVTDVAFWAQGAFDAYAMGNYPYISSYISGDPAAPLPAWPMRAACQLLLDISNPPTLKSAASASPPPAPPPAPSPAVLLRGLGAAVGLMYNTTGEVGCYSLDAAGPAAGNSGPWDYQFCTELDGQEVPYYPANGKTDMFWDQGPFDLSSINKHCRLTWGVTPRVYHAYTMFGGVEAAAVSSNIVFSNGLMDPWSVFGVMANISSNPSVLAINIPNGAHHIDLMFSHPDDTPDIITARLMELTAIRSWIQQYKQYKQY